MDWFKPFNQKQTNLHTNRTRKSIPVHRNLFSTWSLKSHNHRKRNHSGEHNYYNKCLYAVILCLTNLAIAPATLAEAVGGVSATAAPVANSSGSVTNQAIQVLQGPYITNTYGGGIQCQGPTLNFTPFITGAGSFQKPYQDYYDDPVYDMSDNYGAFDDDGKPIGDGIIDNPGKILFYMPTRTGQKDNYNLSLGLSATLSIPLDNSLQEKCKAAADTHTQLQQQLLANKRLDFELARLKNCGDMKKKGIYFHPKSPYYSVCADVIVTNPGGIIPPHNHSIPSPSTSSGRVSKDAADLGGPLQTK